MADCTDCKWWMSIDRYCLLGRDEARCEEDPARRGDDELAERLLDLSDDQREDFKRRMKHAHDEGARIDFREDPEWE